MYRRTNRLNPPLPPRRATLCSRIAISRACSSIRWPLHPTAVERDEIVIGPTTSSFLLLTSRFCMPLHRWPPHQLQPHPLVQAQTP